MPQDIIPPFKRCTKCKQEYPATTEYFYKRAKSRDGLTPACKECTAAYHRKYCTQPEVRKKMAAQQREYRANNPEMHEKHTAYMREYHAKPESRKKQKVHNQIRRAAENSAEGTFTHQDIGIALRSQKGKCWHCGKLFGDDYHVDHLIPLSRGGTNWPNNIVIACAFCNLSKHDKLTQEWNGRLF